MFGIGSIIGGAAGAAASLAGSAGKNKSIRDYLKSLHNQMDENQDIYDRKANEDSTQLASSQSILKDTWNRIMNRNKQIAGSLSVMGGTNESAAAEKAANADAMANAASQIAVAGQNRKDQAERDYLARKEKLQGQIDNANMQKQGLWDTVGNALAGAAQGMGAGTGVEDSIRRMANPEKYTNS